MPHTPSAYDFVFLGMGCANALLLRSLHRHGLLNGKRIGIIEPDPDGLNQKTFCFWSTDKEAEEWGLTSLISKSWSVCMAGNRTQALSPYRYRHIAGQQLLQSTREILAAYECRWMHAHVAANSERPNSLVLHESGDEIIGEQFFDSRPLGFQEPKGTEVRLIQSFRGWHIQTNGHRFNEEECVLMDFNIPQSDFTQFMYVLPFSETTALVECTRFGTQLIGQKEADQLLTDYIQRNFGAHAITGHEQGAIPMCTAEALPVVRFPNWLATGGRAGNIKPSTGYSFLTSCRAAERMAQMRTDAPRPARFRFYDRLLLHILERNPALGKPIFLSLFRTIPFPLVVRFLREETNGAQELPILATLPWNPFLKAALRDRIDRLSDPRILTLIAASVIFLMQALGLTQISAGILVGGLLLLGLPHGAIDHLLESGRPDARISPAYIAQYLLFSAVMGLCWWISPMAGLILFLLYSSWHFGETEYQTGQQKAGPVSLLWGSLLLGFLLCTHPAETTAVLAEMRVELPFMLSTEWGWACLAALLILHLRRSRTHFLFALYLIATPLLPLLYAFGLYFIFDHSVKSAHHISRGLQAAPTKLYQQAIPFTLGAIALGVGFYSFDFWKTNGATGLFFIFLSCLSFPHVRAMARFYRTINHNQHP
ncbi:MAG: beta-carotene 15,15'-dioxygenase, Brp/Blh family [Bacteroidia bacterium]